MSLTSEDLKAIGELIDHKLDFKLEPIHKKLEILDELVIKVDKILRYLPIGNEDIEKKINAILRKAH